MPAFRRSIMNVTDPLERTLEKISELMLRNQCFKSADIFYYGRTAYAINVAYRNEILTVVLSTQIYDKDSECIGRDIQKYVQKLNQSELSGYYSIMETSEGLAVTYNQRIGLVKSLPDRRVLEHILDTGIAKLGYFTKNWRIEQWQETMNQTVK